MNALEMVQQALAIWRDYHGNESLYEQCQRFEGYYMSWSYAGTDSGITTYDSARHAGDHSQMISASGVNDPTILPGDSLYWWWGEYDHICTGFGWDKGRLLVSNTAEGGDNLGDLGNHVKISHADTIQLEFRGISRRNGVNIQRVGVGTYPTSPSPKPEPKPEPPKEEDDDMPKNSGIYWPVTGKDDTYIYAIFNAGSGWYHEFGQGPGGGTMPGGYNNAVATALDTPSWAAVTEGHAKQIIAACEAVRAAGK